MANYDVSPRGWPGVALLLAAVLAFSCGTAGDTASRPPPVAPSPTGSAATAPVPTPTKTSSPRPHPTATPGTSFVVKVSALFLTVPPPPGEDAKVVVCVVPYVGPTILRQSGRHEAALAAAVSMPLASPTSTPSPVASPMHSPTSTPSDAPCVVPLTVTACADESCATKLSGAECRLVVPGGTRAVAQGRTGSNGTAVLTASDAGPYDVRCTYQGQVVP